MKVPELSHGAFLYLSALMDGEPRTRREICAVVGWPSYQKGAFRNREAKLVARGLVRIADGKGVPKEPGRQLPNLIVITDAGRAAWREYADFALWAINRFGGAGKSKGKAAASR